MTMLELADWREKFKVVDGTPQMKTVAKVFQNEFDLQKLKGYQVYALLRDNDTFFNLLKSVIE